MPQTRVLTGLDVLRASGFAELRHQGRVGLVTHPAAVAADFAHARDLLAAALGGNLTTIFGPEHGLFGQAQDLIGVTEQENGLEPTTTTAAQRRVFSLYGSTAASLRPTPEQLAAVDVLVIDLQDIGTRYYTFQATMLYCLQAALPLGKRVVVLDRPNPLGLEQTEGPALRPGYESFVGCHNIPARHGLTMGELAQLYVAELALGPGELSVIPCQGLLRHMTWQETGCPWVLPSPNMPTLETALVYPGQCLLEGTNLSEGRGTTRPFELCGAPWIVASEMAAALQSQAEHLPGVHFRPVHFRPTFQKFAGQDCGGVQLHVTDAASFRPVRTTLALLETAIALSGSHFAWRTEIYEFVSNPIAIDLLFGSDRERQLLAGAAARGWQETASLWDAEESDFAAKASKVWIYSV